MIQTALSIEQMKHLEELGLDTSDASMWWYLKYNYITKASYPPKLCIEKPIFCNYPNKVISAYTLQDILSKLELFTFTTSINGGYNLSWLDRVEKPRKRHDVYDESMLDAAYKMLCWCIENGYIKTK